MKKKYLELMRRRKIGNSDNSYIYVSRDIRKRQLVFNVKRKIKALVHGVRGLFKNV